MKNSHTVRLVSLSAAVLLVIAATAYTVAHRDRHPAAERPTYFTYDDRALQQLHALSSDDEISVKDIYLWDQKVFQSVISNRDYDVDAARLYSYLAVAQYEYAALSYNATGKFSGDINLISKSVVCLFAPDDCADLSLSTTEDAFTQKATMLVMDKIKDRLALDKAGSKPALLRNDPSLWSGPQPSVGIEVMSRLPWHLANASEFRASPPDMTQKAGQLKDVKQAVADITPEQRLAVVFWTGGPGTKTPPGIWLNIADKYMNSREAEVSTVLGVRRDLTQAMADAVIATFDSKYYYLQKRPVQADPTLKTIMPTPNHPSYPSAHATISGAASVVLTHYFADDKPLWEQRATEAANSRFWGGIHYQMDSEAGLIMGRQVGDKTMGQRP